jgi:hypothetical protein
MVDANDEYSARYATQLGTLFGNLTTLETMLRAALSRLDTPHEQRPQLVRDARFPLNTLSVGDQVPENWFNRHMNLDKLIDEYNERAKTNGFGVVGDPEIYELRNALAHGIAWASDPSDFMNLIRFRTVAEGIVRVEAKHIMTDEWFAVQRQRIFAAIQIVRICVNTLAEDGVGS